MGKPMQIQVKLRDLVESEDALGRIATQPNLSARMSYTLALVLQEVAPRLKAKHKAHRDLLKRLGAPVAEDSDRYKVKPENSEQFEKEYNEMLDAPVTLTGIGRIKVSALEGEGIKFAGDELYNLRWLLKGDVEPMFEDEETKETTD